ncbi:MAG: substrate-binding domain-containing protein, partial [Pseudomonadota bacterium]
TTIDRAAGFQEIVKGKKGVRASISYAQAYSFDAGREAMAEILKKRPAEAYFCGDDILSLGAISAIKDAGLSVPADIGILGFNDMTMANWAGIELSTIHQPLPEIITGSVDLAISNLEDPGRYPELRLFPCTIIDRNTLVAKSA